MTIHAAAQSWVLETRTSGYALGLNGAGLLAHRYWGPRLPRVADYPPPPDPSFWHPPAPAWPGPRRPVHR